mmetsp:Transcript_49506/g.165290  ORF Transcript_49506/g.165290 Transcript_49506/m.165290 type:complete len:318 (+) Transcript_49506:284-1237(+)
MRPAAALGRREVHEECVHAGALRREEAAVLVVVHAVELAWLVPQDLEGLKVALVRHHRQVCDPVRHGLRQRVALARVVRAPALRARAHRGELVACKRAREVARAAGDKGLRLLVAHKVGERHDPRSAPAVRPARPRHSSRRVLRKIAKDAPHRRVDRLSSLLRPRHRGGRVGRAGAAPPPRLARALGREGAAIKRLANHSLESAHSARGRAADQTVGAVVARAGRGPRLAVIVEVVARIVSPLEPLLARAHLAGSALPAVCTRVRAAGQHEAWVCLTLTRRRPAGAVLVLVGAAAVVIVLRVSTRDEPREGVARAGR